MKKNKKNYEMMTNGWLEALKDYEPWRYSELKMSHDDYYIDRMVKAINDLKRFYSHFESFLTDKICNERAEKIWYLMVPYRTKRISMGYFSSGATNLNIVRSLDSFTKLFQEISRFFSWNGNKENDLKVEVGNTLEECIINLNKYFQTVKIIHFSGPESVIWFIIALGNITREMYLQCLPAFGKVLMSKNEYDDIKYIVSCMGKYPEYHTDEDDDYLSRLPFHAESKLSEIFRLDLSDTGLDTMYIIHSNDTLYICRNIDRIKEMYNRWKDTYNKEHTYTPTSSYAHEEALAASFDLFSDD